MSKKRNKRNIFLVGPMGAGKSTIGRNLARMLKKEFYDTDRVVEKRTGVDLSWMFDVEGEEGFCKRESKILKELVTLSNIILATGGGTILSVQNRRLLKENGLVIYLKTHFTQQLKRTYYNKYNRPVLRDCDVKFRLVELNKQRNPLYEEIADATFSTGTRPIKKVVTEICRYLKTVD